MVVVARMLDRLESRMLDRLESRSSDTLMEERSNYTASELSGLIGSSEVPKSESQLPQEKSRSNGRPEIGSESCRVIDGRCEDGREDAPSLKVTSLGCFSGENRARVESSEHVSD